MLISNGSSHRFSNECNILTRRTKFEKIPTLNGRLNADESSGYQFNYVHPQHSHEADPNLPKSTKFRVYGFVFKDATYADFEDAYDAVEYQLLDNKNPDENGNIKQDGKGRTASFLFPRTNSAANDDLYTSNRAKNIKIFTIQLKENSILIINDSKVSLNDYIPVPWNSILSKSRILDECISGTTIKTKQSYLFCRNTQKPLESLRTDSLLNNGLAHCPSDSEHNHANIKDADFFTYDNSGLKTYLEKFTKPKHHSHTEASAHAAHELAHTGEQYLHPTHYTLETLKHEFEEFLVSTGNYLATNNTLKAVASGFHTTAAISFGVATFNHGVAAQTNFTNGNTAEGVLDSTQIVITGGATVGAISSIVLAFGVSGGPLTLGAASVLCLGCFVVNSILTGLRAVFGKAIYKNLNPAEGDIIHAHKLLGFSKTEREMGTVTRQMAQEAHAAWTSFFNTKEMKEECEINQKIKVICFTNALDAALNIILLNLTERFLAGSIANE